MDAALERLQLILEWYKGMVDEKTGRILYEYDPVRDTAVADGSPIRDIGSVWDVEVLSAFLHRHDLVPMTERSLRYFERHLVRRDGDVILDPLWLHEPSSIAHSAFMILSLLRSELPGRDAKIAALAEGILHRQRLDGSYAIFFGRERDVGVELYPGEAMLALMEAHRALHRRTLLSSVERGFTYELRYYESGAVESADLVFYANWQSQYASLLFEEEADPELRERVRDYVFALHDRIDASGFYDHVEKWPHRQWTVEVACALEGVNDAYAIARHVGDAERMRAYERSIRVALTFPFRVQRLADAPPREKGGFGHSLDDRTQRVDVTGHAVGGLIKTAQNGIAS